MNYFIVILNRVYYTLTKFKNQSPFLGTVILVAILVCIIIRDFVLLVFAFNNKPLKTERIIDYLIIAIIFVIIYFYATKRKSQIKDITIKSSTFKNIFIISLFLFFTVSFILLANINRKKIFKDQLENLSDKHKNNSLESKIKKLFE